VLLPEFFHDPYSCIDLMVVLLDVLFFTLDVASDRRHGGLPVFVPKGLHKARNESPPPGGGTPSSSDHHLLLTIDEPTTKAPRVAGSYDLDQVVARDRRRWLGWSVVVLSIAAATRGRRRRPASFLTARPPTTHRRRATVCAAASASSRRGGDAVRRRPLAPPEKVARIGRLLRLARIARTARMLKRLQARRRRVAPRGRAFARAPRGAVASFDPPRRRHGRCVRVCEPRLSLCLLAPLDTGARRGLSGPQVLREQTMAAPKYDKNMMLADGGCLEIGSITVHMLQVGRVCCFPPRLPSGWRHGSSGQPV